MQLYIIEVSLISEGNICGTFILYSLRYDRYFGKVIAMREYEMPNSSHLEWRKYQKDSRAIPTPIHSSLQPCCPFNYWPFFPQPHKKPQRQRSECYKMRPIHPQSCVCTLRGSIVIHTLTAEWQLTRPQILSVCLVTATVGATLARTAFPDDERDKEVRDKKDGRLIGGQIPVMRIDHVAWRPVDWLTGGL